MIIKEITYAVKKGQPNFGSISAGITITVQPHDKMEAVWDKARRECENQCTSDPSWVTKDDADITEKKQIAQEKIQQVYNLNKRGE
jgi:hypothetical protein